ncbi:MAG: hypothetical protein NXI10_17570 [bacterium]|nr:hypothetical protein [bacterium]
MNRAFYIVGIVFSVIFFFVCGYYIAEVHDARMMDLFASGPYGSYDLYSSFGSGIAESLTEEAGMVSLFFFLSFITIDLLGLLKVKTSTAKVMSIIGLAISGIFLLWNFAMLSSPGSLSFDEVGVGFLLYCFIMLAFTIVGLIQSVKYAKNQGQGTTAQVKEQVDVLDS